jgi:predicted ATPase with chaperone activity
MKLPSFQPRAAGTIEQTGLPRGLIFELILKRIFLEGTTSIQRLAESTRLEFEVVSTVFQRFRKEQLCEAKGLVGRDYELTLTAQGARMAEDTYRKNQYSGPAPVSLAEYCSAVREQALQPHVTYESLSDNLSDLIVSEELIRALGTAIMTGGALFLYGPTGNGKSSISERLSRIFDDCVYVPYAVEVSGQILSVYDAVVHKAIPEQPPDMDRRWVLCRRPLLSIGGELRAEMLEPRVDEVTRMCLAPLSMLANNGILVIDDFGRQHIQPRELLNRWIVPLDRRIDSFSLWSGIRFTVPFEVMVVFATNLELNQLAEEAFVRRIKNKIRIDNVTPQMFVQIFRHECKRRGIECSEEMGEYTGSRCAEFSPQGLRACFPRDLLDIISGAAAFEQRAARLEHADLDDALKLYFAK